MSRHRYPVEICRVFERTATTKLQAALASPKESDSNEAVDVSEGGNKVSEVPRKMQNNRKGAKQSEPRKNTNDGACAKLVTLKTVLGEGLGYGPALSEHIILDAGLIPNTKVTKDSNFDIDTIQRLVQSVSKFEDWLEDVISGEQVPEGYILIENKNIGKNCSPSESKNGSQVNFSCCIYFFYG